MPDIILSVKPRFAAAILTGSKKYEYRRVSPRLEPDDVVWIYESSPTCALVGGFTVNDVISDKVEKVWMASGDKGGLLRFEFDRYFHGVPVGIAIGVATRFRLEEPVRLGDLRQFYESFQPPQSFRYVDTLPDGGKKLRSIAQDRR